MRQPSGRRLVGRSRRRWMDKIVGNIARTAKLRISEKLTENDIKREKSKRKGRITFFF